jgi:nucleotide-binding universal stress UspA family protein
MAFKRILCGVDFSPDSIKAFRVAIELARMNSGALHLFHAVEAQPVIPGEVVIKVLDRANAAMESLIASAQPELNGLSLSSEVTSGEAFVEIVERARDWKADLVVLGSKGATSLEEIIVGSTAEHAMKESPCSVLIVRG